MKKVLIGLLVLLVVLSLAGCGKKASERAAEKMLAGFGMDADIDGDQVVIKGDDGAEMTFGSGQWPSSDLANHIPEYKGGKITSVMETDDAFSIMIEEVSEGDFTKYLKEIKDTFTEDTFEMTIENGMYFAASNGDGISVSLTFEQETGLIISVAQVETEDN